jgi:hypothetical protein
MDLKILPYSLNRERERERDERTDTAYVLQVCEIGIIHVTEQGESHAMDTHASY